MAQQKKLYRTSSSKYSLNSYLFKNLPIRPSTPLEVDLDGLPSRFNGSRPRILKASLGSAAGNRK